MESPIPFLVQDRNAQSREPRRLGSAAARPGPGGLAGRVGGAEEEPGSESVQRVFRSNFPLWICIDDGRVDAQCLYAPSSTIRARPPAGVDPKSRETTWPLDREPARQSSHPVVPLAKTQALSFKTYCSSCLVVSGRGRCCLQVSGSTRQTPVRTNRGHGWSALRLQ